MALSKLPGWEGPEPASGTGIDVGRGVGVMAGEVPTPAQASDISRMKIVMEISTRLETIACSSIVRTKVPFGVGRILTEEVTNVKDALFVLGPIGLELAGPADWAGLKVLLGGPVLLLFVIIIEPFGRYFCLYEIRRKPSKMRRRGDL